MRHKIDNVNNKASASDPTDPDEDPLELIHAVMHAVRARQYRAWRDGPLEITHMDSKVLGFFARHPGATQSDLAQHSGRDKAQLARLIKGLRERGLLEAKVDAEDRRAVHLRLSAAGDKLQRAVQRQAQRVGALALLDFGAAERRELAALLRRVRANLDAPE